MAGRYRCTCKLCADDSALSRSTALATVERNLQAQGILVPGWRWTGLLFRSKPCWPRCDRRAAPFLAHPLSRFSAALSALSAIFLCPTAEHPAICDTLGQDIHGPTLDRRRQSPHA